MDLNKIVRQAMLDSGIDGKMELIKQANMSYTDVTKIMNNDGSVKLTKVVELLDFLGYKLKAELM